MSETNALSSETLLAPPKGDARKGQEKDRVVRQVSQRRLSLLP